MYRKESSSKAIILSKDQQSKINKRNNIKDIEIIENEVEIIEKHSMNLPNIIQNRLFEHQKYGVNWLYRAYKQSSGGILGDDMGLGKTFQVCCLLCGLFNDQDIQKVLIVSPVSVITSWFREINEHIKSHVSNLSVDLITSDITKSKRQKILREIFQTNNQQIIVTSYNLLSNISDDLNSGCWDYVILDEGHMIKNPSTRMSKAAHIIQSKHRLLLTGTPIQNNLMELYHLVHWATNGKTSLGTKKNFTLKYENFISIGQNPNCTDIELARSQRAAQELRSLLKPILLQRKKVEFEDVLKLPEKIEVAVWIPLSRKQRKMYEAYLQNIDTPLIAINYLKTLSRHPFLLEASEVIKHKQQESNKEIDILTNSLNSMNIQTINSSQSSSKNFNSACDKISMGVLSRPKLNQLERSEMIEREKNQQSIETKNRTVEPSSITNNEINGDIIDDSILKDTVFAIAGRTPTSEELLQDSIKLQVCLKLLRKLRREDHRILVFSQSKLMLDIIQKVLADYGISSCRIDGTICGKDRQRVIDKMNDLDNDEVDICLLTTKACGFGITLTGADRVIVFDPSWNPAEDRQAVDRIYRIGQTRDVVVYRFIMAGSLEQEMYKKEVFKDGLRVASEREIDREDCYFGDDSHKLFELNQSLVMHELKERESLIDQNHPFLKYPDEIKDQTIEGVLGFTKHDLLYATSITLQSQSQSQLQSNTELTTDSELSSLISSLSLAPELISNKIKVNNNSNDDNILDLTQDVDSQTKINIINVQDDSDNNNTESEEDEDEDEDEEDDDDNENENDDDDENDNDNENENIQNQDNDDLIDSDTEVNTRNNKFQRLKKANTTILQENKNTKVVLENQNKNSFVIDLTSSELEDESSSISILHRILTNEKKKDTIQIINQQNENHQNISINKENESNFTNNLVGNEKINKINIFPMKRLVELKNFIQDKSNGVDIPIYYPSSAITRENEIKYDRFIQLGYENENLHNYEEATQNYIQAIQICDEDIELHKKLSDLKKLLEINR